MKPKIEVPSLDKLSKKSQNFLTSMQKTMGKIPNMYAITGYSENALQSYLSFSNRKSSLSSADKEIINLLVSQLNNCDYCIAAHIGKAKANAGFTDQQITSIRKCEFSDAKQKALGAFIKEVVENKGTVKPETLEQFFNAGYTNENLVDAVLLVADRIFTNYLHAVTDMPIDFPEVPKI